MLDYAKDKWIRVKLKDDTIKDMSLFDVFNNINEIQELHGETKAQDLSILRFLLALTTTVYSRNNVNGSKYETTTKEELLDTWDTLNQSHDFTAVVNYLNEHADAFQDLYCIDLDLFGKLTTKTKPEKILAGSVDALPISSLNRTINQSNNSYVTYGPRAGININDITKPEFMRWIIAYEQFTTVSDKNKNTAMIKKKKGKKKDKNKSKEKDDSSSRGYTYSLTPIYVKGHDLAETLILNMVLFTDDGIHESKPFWEQDLNAYLDVLAKAPVPDNIPELYTYPSRLFYRDGFNLYPITFKLFDTANLFLEPMTGWFWHKQTEEFWPETPDPTKSMWRSFGQYVNTTDETHMPGVVQWIRTLQDADLLPFDFKINLAKTALVNDGNATSQMIVNEINDDLTIDTAVVYGEDGLVWMTMIEDAITATQDIANAIKAFDYSMPEADKSVSYLKFNSRLQGAYYSSLNVPFNNWLNALNSDQDPDEQFTKWIKIAKQTAKQTINDYIKTVRNFNADSSGKTVFNYQAIFFSKIRKVTQQDA